MSLNSDKARRITLAIVGGVLAVLTVLPSPGTRPATADDAARALLYGKADASWTTRAAELAAGDATAALKLGKLAESTNVDSLERTRVLDALALAGTPAAEAALFEALCVTSARNDGTYPLLMAGAHGAPSRQARATTNHKR